MRIGVRPDQTIWLEGRYLDSCNTNTNKHYGESLDVVTAPVGVILCRKRLLLSDTVYKTRV